MQLPFCSVSSTFVVLPPQSLSTMESLSYWFNQSWAFRFKACSLNKSVEFQMMCKCSLRMWSSKGWTDRWDTENDGPNSGIGTFPQLNIFHKYFHVLCMRSVPLAIEETPTPLKTGYCTVVLSVHTHLSVIRTVRGLS